MTSAGKAQGPVPKPRTRVALPVAPRRDERSPGTNSVQPPRATEKLRGRTSPFGPQRGQGRGTRATPFPSCRCARCGGGTPGRGIPKGDSRANESPSRPTRYPLKTVCAEEGSGHPPQSCPPSHLGAGRGPGEGSEDSRGTAASPPWPRAGTQVTGTPAGTQRHARSGCQRPGCGEVPRSVNFPGPWAAGPGQVRSPEPREPKPLGCRLPGARGPAGYASVAGRVCSSRGSAPVEGGGPTPTRARCRETRVGRRALCIKAAVTSRGARVRGSKGRGLAPGAEPEEEEE